MKHLIIYTLSLVTLLSLCGCYADKGGNDFDTVLPDVEITIPEDAYSGSLGQTITVTPTIKSDIDNADLEYHWEVNGAVLNPETGREMFSPLVPDDQQAQTLTYTCHLDSSITSLNKGYTCRLRVHQKSTGRDFYSASTFTITIEGITGLMVLYGDDSQSDIGILQAEEFMPSSSSIPTEPSASTSLYSMNTGSKLQGKGQRIVQATIESVEWYGDNVKDYCRILAMTDKAQQWLNRNDFSVYGDWNALFYLQGSRKVNAGDPRGYDMVGDWSIAFDGDDVFLTSPTSAYQYLFPMFTPQTECKGGNKFTFAPKMLKVGSSGIQKLMYATSVNGDKTRNGFVAITNGSTSNMNKYTELIDTKDDAATFNPGDMQASLVDWGVMSNNHAVAVMKGNSGRAKYAGQYFLADLLPSAKSGGASGYLNIPQHLYDLSALTNIASATAFAFGSTQNMCYYATPGAVYRYGIDGTNATAAAPIIMTDGTAVGLKGDVTMMKMLASPNTKTHNSDEILLVATWDGSASHLYALHLDNMTGNVTKVATYDAASVTGWAFGKIYDVNIKSL